MIQCFIWMINYIDIFNRVNNCTCDINANTDIPLVNIQDDTSERLEVNLQKKLSISVPDLRENLVGNVMWG